MANQGSHVLAQKLSITTLSPNDVRITEMKSALTALFKALTSIEQQVISLETTIHNSIEECRSRKIEHETELVDKESKIAVLRSEVEGLEDKIAAHENEASTIENGASELDERAADIRDTARRKRENAGLGAFISGLVGIALTPFTGKNQFFLSHSCIAFRSYKPCRCRFLAFFEEKKQIKTKIMFKRKETNFSSTKIVILLKFWINEKSALYHVTCSVHH